PLAARLTVPPPPAKPVAKAPAAAPAASPPPAPPPALPPPPPPPVEVATLPLPPTGNAYWETRNAQNMLELIAGDRPSVLFLGDSITDLIASGAGQPVWDAMYAPLGSLDFGIGGFRTSQVLWQVETGQVA